MVEGFEEKPQFEGWINGGFFCFEQGALDYLGEDSVLEREPLERLAADGQLRAYRHTGFWDCMDTYKDAVLLNDLWAAGEAPEGICIGCGENRVRDAYRHDRSHPVRGDPPALRRVLRSQKDVGQYIVDHLEEAAFHTAEELARRANTSSSTVVRFAQALGFEGFPELQAAARDEYRRARDNGAGTAELTTQPLFPIDQTEFETALGADHANMAETARKVDRDEVAAAVDLISHAERIVLCGTDQMAFFASYLRHLLMLLDLRAEVVASPSQEGLAKLGRVDDKTVMVGFSAGRRTRSWSARSSWGATGARPRSRSPTPPCPRWRSWRTTSSTTRPTAPRSCARTRALLALIQALAYGVYALDESAYSDRIKAFRLK